MGVQWKTKKNKFPEMERAAVQLNGRRVNVGVYGEQAWLAGIHEYGCDIVPKKAKYLTVPCNPKAKGKRARDFKNLFFVQAKSGEKFLARPVGKDRFEVMFWLTRKVHIPERAFLRNGYDENIDRICQHTETMLPSVLSGKMKVQNLCKSLGLELSSAIKDYARNLQDPPDTWATIETKGSSNPLVDTGDMIGSITYEVQ